MEALTDGNGIENDFKQKRRSISETVQDRTIVTIKRLCFIKIYDIF